MHINFLKLTDSISIFLQPLIDCVICYKASAGEIAGKTYLNCMNRRTLSKVFPLHVLHFDNSFHYLEIHLILS